MQKADKERVVAELTERLQHRRRRCIVADYRGLTDDRRSTTLRAKLIEHGARVHVGRRTRSSGRAAEAAGRRRAPRAARGADRDRLPRGGRRPGRGREGARRRGPRRRSSIAIRGGICRKAGRDRRGRRRAASRRCRRLEMLAAQHARRRGRRPADGDRRSVQRRRMRDLVGRHRRSAFAQLEEQGTTRKRLAQEAARRQEPRQSRPATEPLKEAVAKPESRRRRLAAEEPAAEAEDARSRRDEATGTRTRNGN